MSLPTVFHRAIWQHQLRDALRYWLLLPAAVLVPGLAGDRLLGLGPLPWPGPRLVTGTLVAAAGGLLVGRAMRDLDRFGNGTPNPLRPPRTLVTEGSYRLCRHPMWLGYDLVALGVILALGSPVTLAVCLPLFVVFQFRFLKKEEHVLALKFTSTYPAYRARTPFLLPRPRPTRPGSGTTKES